MMIQATGAFLVSPQQLRYYMMFECAASKIPHSKLQLHGILLKHKLFRNSGIAPSMQVDFVLTTQELSGWSFLFWFLPVLSQQM